MPKLDAKARLDALQAVSSALAHPARRQILLTIHFRGGSMTAGEIAGRFAHAWPTTTRHLQALEGAGLLECEKQGRVRKYHIRRAALRVFTEWLSYFDDVPKDQD